MRPPETYYRIRSDDGLTLETLASESLYGGQFTLSTHLIKPNYLNPYGSCFFVTLALARIAHDRGHWLTFQGAQERRCPPHVRKVLMG